MLFARRMFFRTRSLEIATEELQRKQAENEYQALHDALTGLPNRVMFHQRLQEELDAAPARRQVAVMIMDLDHFKEINDTLGHHHGDLLLREIGPRVGGALREGDIIARLGGDEFGVLLREVGGERAAADVARRVLRALEQPFVLEGLALNVSGSIGIACSPDHGGDVETLLQRADVAMYAAKESRAGYELYAPDRDRYSPERLELLGQLRGAIDDQLVLYFQPKAELPDGRILGAEALVRWRHPLRGLILPDEFIPLAERTALLTPLTLRVLEDALRQVRMWRELGLELQVAVNLSPRNLVDLHLPDEIAGMLHRWNVPAGALMLEITENTLMTDPNRAIDVLARLSAIGVGLSIDDFGTGHSSLSYLKRLPVQELKIDKSFVMNMVSDPNDAIIVRSTIELSHNLGLRVVAEGVESDQAWNQLAALGCDVAQGYYLGRPMPPAEFTGWLEERVLGLNVRELTIEDERRAHRLSGAPGGPVQ
jgi:diguanylate cyclase (GGDEF)-like protein